MKTLHSDGTLGETVVLYLLMLTYAAFTTLIGAVLTRLILEFAMPLDQGGLFISVQNGGCFIGILLSGVLIDRYSKRRLIILSYGCLAFALLAVSLSSTLFGYLALLFLAGAAAKLLDALLNIRVSSIHAANKGFYLNLLHCNYAVGSLCGPLMAGAFLDHGLGWRISYFVVGAVCLALFLFYALMFRIGGLGTEKPSVVIRQTAAGSVVNRPMLLICGAILLYSGYEVGVNNWLPAYISETTGADATVSGSIVSVFWLGLIVGRIICSMLIRRIEEKKLIIAGGVLGSLSLAAAILAGGQAAAFVGAAGAGLLSGAIPPMVFTLVYTWHHEAQAKASFMLFVAITIGAIVLPWSVGRVAGRVGLGGAMLADAALLLAAAIIVAFIPGRRPKTI